MRLGTLEFVEARERPELVAPAVAQAIGSLKLSGVGVAVIDPTLSDTAAFCEKYQIGPELAANCVIVEGKSPAAAQGSGGQGGEARQLAAVVILGSMRADINGAVRGFLGAKKVSFAQVEKAIAESRMEFGAITPIGLPSTWPILIDRRVAEAEALIVGAGVRSAKLCVPGHVLAALPNAHIIDDLAYPKVE